MIMGVTYMFNIFIKLRGFIFHDIHQKNEEGVRAIDLFSLYVCFPNTDQYQ